MLTQRIHFLRAVEAECHSMDQPKFTPILSIINCILLVISQECVFFVCTQYNIAIIIFTYILYYPFNWCIFIIVDASEPPAPIIDSVIPLDNELVITWDITIPHVAITHYEVTVGEETKNVPGHVNFAIFSNLMFGQQYFIIISAVNEFGISAPATTFASTGCMCYCYYCGCIL